MSVYRANRDIPVASLEEGLELLREAVHGRDAMALEEAEAYCHDLDRVAAAADVLAALAAYDVDPKEAQDRLSRAIERALGQPRRDSAAAGELTVALLTAGRIGEACGVARAEADERPEAMVGQLALALVASARRDTDEVVRLVTALVKDQQQTVALLDALSATPMPPSVYRTLVYGTLRAGKAHLARVFADRALELRPDDIELHRQRARCLLVVGAPNGAVADARLAYEGEPEHPDALPLLVATLISAGAITEALALIEPLLPVATRAPSDVVTCVSALSGGGRNDEALSLARVGRDAFPHDLQVMLAEIDAWSAAGQHDQALHAVSEQLDEFPGSLELLTRRARILRVSGGSQQELREALEQIIAISPLDVRSYVDLAQVLVSEADEHSALELLDRAEGIDGYVPTVPLLRARILHRAGRNDDALEAIKHAQTIDPGNADSLALQAEVLVALGRVAEAASFFESAAQVAPVAERAELAGKAVENARQLAVSGALGDAVAILERLRGRGQLSLAGRPLYAEVLRVTGRRREAIELAEEILTEVPDDMTALCTKAAVLVDLGRSADALDTVELALKLAPSYEFAAFTRCYALYSLERTGEALHELDTFATPGDGPDPYATFRSAALSDLGHHQDAIELLEGQLLRHGTESEQLALEWQSNLGFLFLRTGQPERTVESLDSLYRVVGDTTLDPYTINNYGLALALAGDPSADELRQVYERMRRAALASDTPRHHSAAAWAEFRLGSYDEARRHADTAIASGTDPKLWIRIMMALLRIAMGDQQAGEEELAQAQAERPALRDRERAEEVGRYADWLRDLLVRDGTLTSTLANT